MIVYGPDDRCVECREHFANPHHPECPYATDDES